MTEQLDKWVRRGGMLAALSVVVSSGCQSTGTQSTSAEPRSVSTSTGWTQKSVMPPEPSFPKGFTCCNLHYEDDWISDSNYADLPMIPVGTTAKVTRYGRHRAYADIAGKPMRLGHDYGRGQETLQQWTAKMIVTDDPKLKIETYPHAIQEAIKQGRLSIGMTKEQVIISVGYPMTSENYSLDAAVWRMWTSSFRKYQVMWGPDGRVKEIVPDPGTGDVMIYKP